MGFWKNWSSSETGVTPCPELEQIMMLFSTMDSVHLLSSHCDYGIWNYSLNLLL